MKVRKSRQSGLDVTEPYATEMLAPPMDARVVADGGSSISYAELPTDRHRLVQQAAYFRAERRGFVGGSPDTTLDSPQAILAMLDAAFSVGALACIEHDGEALELAARPR